MKTARLLFALSLAPALFAASKYQSDVLTLKPIGFWPLSGDANDVSGNGNNGTLMNGAFFSSLNTSPVNPQFAVFNSAKNQSIVMPQAGSQIFNLGSLHALTAMAWVKTVSQGNGGVPIISKVDTTTNTGWALILDNSDSSDPSSSGRVALVFIVNGQPTLVVEPKIAKNDGGWHLLAATYDGSGKASGVQIYLDGLEIASQFLEIDADAISSGSILNSGPLVLGGGVPSANGGLFDGNISGAAVFGTALTPAQILQLAEDGSTAGAILPQFAFGGGWYSAVYFSNASGDSVSFTVHFLADNGTPLAGVPGGATQTINLGPFASTIIEAPNSGDLSQGYAYVFLPPLVTGYGIFRQSIPGVADQEAVAPLTPSGGGNLTLVYDDVNSITAVALVNLSQVTSTITATVSDINGNVIATSSPIMLPPLNKTENLLRNFPGLSAIAGNRGKVQFISTGGPVTVLGFRAHGVAFTDIPAMPAFQLAARGKSFVNG